MISLAVALAPSDFQRRVIDELGSDPELALEICSQDPKLLKAAIEGKRPQVVLWEPQVSEHGLVRQASTINPVGQTRLIAIARTSLLGELPKLARNSVFGLATAEIDV